MLITGIRRILLILVLSCFALLGLGYFYTPKIDMPDDQVIQASMNTLVKKEGHILKNEDFAYQVSETLAVKNFANPLSAFSFHSLSDSDSPFKIQLITDLGPIDLTFQMEPTSLSEITGFNEKYRITYLAHILENGRVNISLTSEKSYKFRFVFSASPGKNRQYAIMDNEIKYLSMSAPIEASGQFKWFGIDFDEHLFAIVFKEKTAIKYKISETGQMSLETNMPSNTLSADLVFTKKDYDLLVGLGKDLKLAVDFGFFDLLKIHLKHGVQFLLGK